MIKYGMPIIAALVLAFATYSVVASRPVRARVAPPAAPPEGTEFRGKVGAVGLVEASSENVAISIPVPGLVTRVAVGAGDRVAKGQTLLALDDRDLRAELALRESAAEVAKARLERLTQMPRPEEIPPAEAKVREAEASLEDANVQLRIIESVKDRRAIREEDLQRRRVAVRAAEARLAEAKSELALLKSGAWDSDIKIARAEVAQAERQVERIQTDIERLTVRAPMAGQVLQCKVRAGEYAQAGPLATPLMLMGAVKELHVRADVDEQDAWRVRDGAAAVAAVRGNSARKFGLKFVRFEPYVVPKKNLTGDSTERVDTRVLEVIYALEAGAPVYVGQQMDVFIEAPEVRQ